MGCQNSQQKTAEAEATKHKNKKCLGLESPEFIQEEDNLQENKVGQMQTQKTKGEIRREKQNKTKVRKAKELRSRPQDDKFIRDILGKNQLQNHNILPPIKTSNEYSQGQSKFMESQNKLKINKISNQIQSDAQQTMKDKKPKKHPQKERIEQFHQQESNTTLYL